MKKIIVTTAICTAFFSTLACAEPPAAPQLADQKADEALGKVTELEKQIQKIGPDALEAKNKSIENEGKIQKHEESIKEIEKNKQEIARIDKDVTGKLEGFRNVSVGNNQKIDEAVKKINTAVQDIEQVKEKANKVTDIETQIGAIQDNANDLKTRVDGHDDKIKKTDEGVATAQQTAEKAQQTAETAQQTAEKAQQTGETAQQTAEKAQQTADTATQKADKVDKEILSLRGEIEKATGASKANVMKEMNALRNQTNKGLAKVTALAGLHPLAFDKNNKLSLSVASGSYKSEHALALGGFYQPNRDVLLSFGSSVGGNDNAYTVGASVRLGSHSKTAEKQHVSQVAELYAAIAKLQAQVEKQQKEIVQLQRAK